MCVCVCVSETRLVHTVCTGPNYMYICSQLQIRIYNMSKQLSYQNSSQYLLTLIHCRCNGFPLSHNVLLLLAIIMCLTK